jgi:hypothetical protein
MLMVVVLITYWLVLDVVEGILSACFLLPGCLYPPGVLPLAPKGQQQYQRVPCF